MPQKDIKIYRDYYGKRLANYTEWENDIKLWFDCYSESNYSFKEALMKYKDNVRHNEINEQIR